MVTGTQTIDRATVIMDIVADGRTDGVSFNEIEAACGLTRPTARRMLHALVQHGYVAQDRETRRYYLGPRIYELSLMVQPVFDFKALSEPSVNRLVDTTGDTVFLNRVTGGSVTCIVRESGSYPVKAFMLDVGVQRTIGLGAGGIAILAAMAPNAADAHLQAHAEELSAFRGGNDSLLDVIEKARVVGYVHRDVPDFGVRTIAKAIRDCREVPFASMSVSSIRDRMQGEHLDLVVNALEKEVARLEHKLSRMRPMTYGR
ncbi:IclR family transcriptional regulator [Sinisalibacter aestuarii]|uniref:Transcriptional regulator n=1 Tax=Sinisalibacter aestuarii TaxID=2949426 RepID=A0ABQ5LY06_9RHOB|nr:helix-turn-helix domain-containing protein [Sinisalibacter aestuarii]GKY89850.1 transcriptional regulator [Sinisalibacter aestuarii]